jgi:hypothetical protein
VHTILIRSHDKKTALMRHENTILAVNFRLIFQAGYLLLSEAGFLDIEISRRKTQE